jgi:hypothetical protein
MDFARVPYHPQPPQKGTRRSEVNTIRDNTSICGIPSYHCARQKHGAVVEDTAPIPCQHCQPSAHQEDPNTKAYLDSLPTVVQVRFDEEIDA